MTPRTVSWTIHILHLYYLTFHWGGYFHSLKLLALYYMLDTAVGAQDTAVNKTDTVLNILRRQAINQKMSKVIADGNKWYEEFITS